VKSNGSVSTSVRPGNVRVATPATGTTTVVSSTSANYNRKPEMPVSPRVDIGPKAYRVFKNQERLVIRFCVGKGWVRGRRSYFQAGRYFVWDMDTGRIAAKTAKYGYDTKQDAIRVARQYRDKFGAYVRVGF
jgi:hypothetical protein